MSEPQKLADFLPEVMRNIRNRCEQNPDNKEFKPTVRRHTSRVISAVTEPINIESNGGDCCDNNE